MLCITILDFVFAVLTSLVFIVIMFSAKVWILILWAFAFVGVSYLLFRALTSIRQFQAKDSIRTRYNLVGAIDYAFTAYLLQEYLMLFISLIFEGKDGSNAMKMLRLFRLLDMSVRFSTDSWLGLILSLAINIAILRSVRRNIN